MNGLRSDVQGVRRDVQGLRGDVKGFQKEVRQSFYRLEKTTQVGFEKTTRSIYNASDSVIKSNQQTVLRIQQQQKAQQQAARSSGGSSGGIKGFFGKVLKVGATAVGTYFGGPVGAAIGSSLGSGLDKAVQGGNRREIAGSTINTGISAGIGIIESRGVSYYPNTKIESPPSQQLFDSIVAEGTNVLKPEIEKMVQERLPKEAVPLINSMLKGNFEQRKRMAINAFASLTPDSSRISAADIQKIMSAKNEQELKNAIAQVASGKELNLNPSVVMYAMDYIL